MRILPLCIGNLLAYVAAFLSLVFPNCYASVAERAVRDNPNLEVAGSNPIPGEVILIRRLLLFFLILFYKTDFLLCSR